MLKQTPAGVVYPILHIIYPSDIYLHLQLLVALNHISIRYLHTLRLPDADFAYYKTGSEYAVDL